MINKLWTRDFTIITIGSIVSLLGNALIGFALGLFVLDYKESTLYFAIFVFLYTLPQIAAPIISGPLMDRFSRRKTIYSLDFFSGVMYLMLGGLLSLGAFPFGIFAGAVFVVGTINSVYQVAFESFYPMVISEGNYSKAYSILSTLETLTFFVIPLSTLAYKSFGLVPVLIASGICFLIAAILERKISDVETSQKYLVEKKTYQISHYVEDMREGWRYIKSERGLLAIAVYFTFSSFVTGVEQIVELPYFKANYENGEFIFMSVIMFSIIGRMIGGAVHYKIKMPVEKKFMIATLVYVAINILGGTYLYLPLMVMRVFMFTIGILGVTSYNIRISSTQDYVPHEKKGRFNGFFMVMMTGGTLIGEIGAGLMSEIMDIKLVLLLVNMVNLLAAIGIMGWNRKEVSKIYNRQA